jgi:hypothetical protein
MSLSSSKRVTGNGLVPVGAIVDFLVEPTGFGNDGSSGYEWLELNGEEYNDSDYAALAAHLAQAGDTFTLPDCTTTGRYRRSRTSSLTEGDTQDNAIKTHTHSVTGTASAGGSHTHTATVTDPGHTHSLDSDILGSAGQQGAAGAGNNLGSTSTADNTTGSNTTGISVSLSTASTHTHDVTGTAAAHAEATTETRPETLVVITCIKT